MKKRLSFALLSVMLIAASCSNETLYEGEMPNIPNQGNDSEGVNANGTVNGLTYSLRNLSVNSELVVLNSGNADLVGSQTDWSQGIIKLSQIDETILPKLVSGKVLYINIGDYVGLKKIVNIVESSDGLCILETEQAHLGEAFEEGDIEISLDLLEAAKTSAATRATDRAFNYEREIIDVTGNYELGGLEYSPSTNIKMQVNMSMKFAKNQLLPKQVAMSFVLDTKINPSFKFAGYANEYYKNDFIEYVPQEVLDFIKSQEFEIEIPINQLGIESIPAKVKIADIHLPTEIEANISKECSFALGINGSFTIGFIADITGLRVKTTPVYKSSIKATAPNTLNLNGELITKTDIVITPSISLLDDFYKMTGDITFGAASTSNGNINVPSSQKLVYGSKGTFTSQMNVMLDLILTKVPIQIFNKEVKLWSVGEINKSVVYSDMQWNVTPKYTTNVLAGTRSYETNFTLNYRFPILGKKVADELLISYDVYEKDGKKKISSEKESVIIPRNVTINSFDFTLNIPYKKEGIFSTKYQTTGFLKNIVIKDRNGYVYEGIYNTLKGIKENSFELTR